MVLFFKDVAQAFCEIEKRSGRLEMTDILAELFKKTSTEEIDKLIYLTQGILAPPYEGIDLGMGEQFAIRAISSISGYSKEQIENHYKKSGDLGITVQELMEKRKQLSLGSEQMNITYVYNSLLKIAKTSGHGSQDIKIKQLTELLNNSSPPEARFIIRFVLGRLRLGIGDPTILDALSVTKAGDKSLREELERAYNVCSDLGYVARVFFQNSEQILKFSVRPFKPLQPALAERLSTPKEIIDKIGHCAAEFKFDGFRLQAHKNNDSVEIYSRKLEKMTHMFPEIVDAVKKLKTNEIIFEGEALAYNEKEKKYYSFQQTIQRKRKHGINQAIEELPLNIFCFDILYLDGKDLTGMTYRKRRKILENIFPSGILKISYKKIVRSEKELNNLFKQSLYEGLEGIMAKDLNAPYAAGKRKFAWIKLKKSYGKAVDTIDGVIVGYYLGKGARAEFEFGGLLIAVYNQDRVKLETIARVGSGYSEEEMRSLQNILEKIRTESAPSNLDYKMQPDFWVEPRYVVEIAFDEITLSPAHTCGIKNDRAYALRFPRMLKLRTDKGINEITTTMEIIEMFGKQHGTKGIT